MPRDSPHPLAFFSLVPLNNRARAVLQNPENAHLVSTFRQRNDDAPLHGLDIGPFIGSKSRYTLATMGRSGDVIVEGQGISRIHCSFELHEGNKTEVMLQDRSSNRSTRLFGETAVGFEPERSHRRVVVDRAINLVFGFGGAACDLLQFQIVWHLRDNELSNLYVNHREDHPRHTRTISDEPPTVAPSQIITRIHTPSLLALIRYSKRKEIGRGEYGEVWRVADVDTGNHLAVKKVKRPNILSHEHVRLKREVETLSRMSHRNIVEYISAQWGADDFLDIIMELKPGSVKDLIEVDHFIKEPISANHLLCQMLQALDYLASHGIVHRDVKPANILWSPATGGEYLYQLADFGLSNLVADARTLSGSPIFMAPELVQNPHSPQTVKMDIWSLFVTLAWAMNAAGFRQKMMHTMPLRIKAVQETANLPEFQPIQDMAIEDPSMRATAGDILEKLFSGEGRTTPRNRISTEAASGGTTPRPGPQRQRVEPVGPALADKPAGDTVEVGQGSQSEPAVAVGRMQAKRDSLLFGELAPDVDAIQKDTRQDASQLRDEFPSWQMHLS